jgi:hypothetical protein
VLLTVSALALTGCTFSIHTESATASTTPAPAFTAEAAMPTPTPLSIAEAGQAYLAMVAAPNAAMAAFGRACDNNDVKAARAAARPAAVALRTFGDQVAATAWPATVQPTATQLLPEIASDLRFFDEVAAAKTDAAAVAIINGYTPRDTSGQAMRTLLGLPDVPVS